MGRPSLRGRRAGGGANLSWPEGPLASRRSLFTAVCEPGDNVFKRHGYRCGASIRKVDNDAPALNFDDAGDASRINGNPLASFLGEYGICRHRVFLTVRVEYVTGLPAALREHAAFVSTLRQRRIEVARCPLSAQSNVRPKQAIIA
jgi:hypothetical protein